ncbi:hypothetical protein [Streptomyces sp. A1136]|uniref:hypothetical protein n=1 Tax=Streptomyces sp. A1136 TaxID=2563102 RepID=UPI00109E46B3|nr:hypothetical protein [Streptomyces sp. A1136]THA53254.1 hypothetical protein E6R62_19385 [Streptomyces sp. A1136]
MNEVVYEKCAKCHFFIEETNASDVADGCAPYIHLDRGDAADEAITGSHDAEPSGERATLAHWQERGPEEMRKRF